VQIALETCRANDERNKEYAVHLVGPELNIYITYMYGTTNIKQTVRPTQLFKLAVLIPASGITEKNITLTHQKPKYVNCINDDPQQMVSV
jgi:hypothetical protein